MHISLHHILVGWRWPLVRRIVLTALYQLSCSYQSGFTSLGIGIHLLHIFVFKQLNPMIATASYYYRSEYFYSQKIYGRGEFSSCLAVSSLALMACNMRYLCRYFFKACTFTFYPQLLSFNQCNNGSGDFFSINLLIALRTT